MQGTELASQMKGFSEPRRRLLPVDPLLLLSAIGLVAFSAWVLDTATHNDIPGQPHFYVYRQVGYGVIGLALMMLLARFDYSRIREWKIGLYAFMIASILFVYAVGGATRGSKRWINFPFFKFQPSELGKVLLILALSGFVVDRVRRLGDIRCAEGATQRSRAP